MLEFLAFCEFKYPKLPPTTRYLVDEPKTFIFLYYQAYRKVRKRGRAKKGEERPTFDASDFERVLNMAPSDNITESGQTTVETTEQVARAVPEVYEKLVGFDVINQAYQAIVQLLHQQHEDNSNRMSVETIKTSRRIHYLKEVVRKRRAIEKKRTFQERISHEVNPYRILCMMKKLEVALWERNKSTFKYGAISLRNRFFFLYTKQSLSRGESGVMADLSELIDFKLQVSREPQPYHILILQMTEGKTNGLATLFGRVMRHKNVDMCAYGALGLYLLARFELTNELKYMDLTKNESWFNIKLFTKMDEVTSVMDKGNEAELPGSNYASAVKKELDQLGIFSHHFLHLGRAVGPAELEMEEVDPQGTKTLGNFNPDTQEKRYSIKLPLSSMRVAGGWDELKGSHYSKRAVQNPIEALQTQVFSVYVEAQVRESVHIEA